MSDEPTDTIAREREWIHRRARALARDLVAECDTVFGEDQQQASRAVLVMAQAAALLMARHTGGERVATLRLGAYVAETLLTCALHYGECPICGGDDEERAARAHGNGEGHDEPQQPATTPNDPLAMMEPAGNA